MPNANRGYVTTIQYEILHQFGNPMTEISLAEVPYNEQWASDVRLDTDTNWEWGPALGNTNRPNALFDTLAPPPPFLFRRPEPEAPITSPMSSSTKVYNRDQQWFIGSTTPGRGRACSKQSSTVLDKPRDCRVDSVAAARSVMSAQLHRVMFPMTGYLLTSGHVLWSPIMQLIIRRDKLRYWRPGPHCKEN